MTLFVQLVNIAILPLSLSLHAEGERLELLNHTVAASGRQRQPGRIVVMRGRIVVDGFRALLFRRGRPTIELAGFRDGCHNAYNTLYKVPDSSRPMDLPPRDRCCCCVCDPVAYLRLVPWAACVPMGSLPARGGRVVVFVDGTNAASAMARDKAPDSSTPHLGIAALYTWSQVS